MNRKICIAGIVLAAIMFLVAGFVTVSLMAAGNLVFGLGLLVTLYVGYIFLLLTYTYAFIG